MAMGREREEFGAAAAARSGSSGELSQRNSSSGDGGQDADADAAADVVVAQEAEDGGKGKSSPFCRRSRGCSRATKYRVNAHLVSTLDGVVAGGSRALGCPTVAGVALAVVPPIVGFATSATYGTAPLERREVIRMAAREVIGRLHGVLTQADMQGFPTDLIEKIEGACEHLERRIKASEHDGVEEKFKQVERLAPISGVLSPAILLLSLLESVDFGGAIGIMLGVFFLAQLYFISASISAEYPGAGRSYRQYRQDNKNLDRIKVQTAKLRRCYGALTDGDARSGRVQDNIRDILGEEEAVVILIGGENSRSGMRGATVFIEEGGVLSGVSDPAETAAAAAEFVPGD